MNIKETLGVSGELEGELRRLFVEIGEAQDEFKNAADQYALCEHEYRKAKAVAFLASSDPEPRKGPSVDHLKALVDERCGHERELAYLARANRESCMERLRSLRAQLSAIQSLAACLRSELELSKGPQPNWSNHEG